jgi:hypothetical protein
MSYDKRYKLPKDARPIYRAVAAFMAIAGLSVCVMTTGSVIQYPPNIWIGFVWCDGAFMVAAFGTLAMTGRWIFGFNRRLHWGHNIPTAGRVLNSGVGPRPYGQAAGEFTVPPNFDQSLPADILDDFEGK